MTALLHFSLTLGMKVLGLAPAASLSAFDPTDLVADQAAAPSPLRAAVVDFDLRALQSDPGGSFLPVASVAKLHLRLNANGTIDAYLHLVHAQHTLDAFGFHAPQPTVRISDFSARSLVRAYNLRTAFGDFSSGLLSTDPEERVNTIRFTIGEPGDFASLSELLSGSAAAHFWIKIVSRGRLQEYGGDLRLSNSVISGPLASEQTLCPAMW